MSDIRLGRLDELAMLEDGWYDGEGYAPTAAALASARDWLPRLPVGVGVYPTLEGGVVFEVMGCAIEWVVYSDGTRVAYDFDRPEGDEEIDPDGDWSEL